LVACDEARESALRRKGLVIVRVGGCWRRLEKRRRVRRTRAVESALVSPSDKALIVVVVVVVVVVIVEVVVVVWEGRMGGQ